MARRTPQVVDPLDAYVRDLGWNVSPSLHVDPVPTSSTALLPVNSSDLSTPDFIGLSTIGQRGFLPFWVADFQDEWEQLEQLEIREPNKETIWRRKTTHRFHHRY